MEIFGIFIMFFFVVLGFAFARVDEISLVRDVVFRRNGMGVANPLHPPFAAWDTGFVGIFDLEMEDLLEIRVTSVFDYPRLFMSVNDGAWDNIFNDTFTRVQLTKRINTIKILSSSYNRYHKYINQSYDFTLYLNSFQLTGSFQSSSFNFSGSSRDNNCTTLHSSSDLSLNFTINLSQSSIILIRKYSYANQDDFQSISANTPFSYPNFFSNWLENILEVTVSNSSSKQIFLFRFHSKIPNYEISKIEASFDQPVDYYGWDLMPRFHPQVYNYTLIGRFPFLAFGNMRLRISTFYPGICYLRPKNDSIEPEYSWNTYYSSNPIFMNVKEDNFYLFCSDLEFRYYTKNYTIGYYRKSKNFNIARVAAFVNPLVKGEGKFNSNSSNLDSGYRYMYDLTSLNDWDSVVSYSPPKELMLTYKTYMSILTYNPIEFPLEPAGVSFLFIPAELGAYFFYNLNGDVPERDFFFSVKTVYPLVPGNNVVFLNITAEDRTQRQWNKYTIPVLNPDFSLKSIKFLDINGTEMNFDNLTASEFRINTTNYNDSITLSAILNNSNSIYEIFSYNDSIISSGGSSLSFALVPDFLSVSSIFTLRVFAESRNWIKNYTIKIEKIDFCGNGKRFNTNEQCDDGNLIDNDGCSNCVVDTNWTCSGGSFFDRDVCNEIIWNTSQNTTADPSSNSTDSSNTTNGNTTSGNSTNQDNSTSDSNSTNTDPTSNSTGQNNQSGNSNQTNESSDDVESSYQSSQNQDSSQSESEPISNEESSSQQSSESQVEQSESSSSEVNATEDSSSIIDSKNNSLIFDGFLPYYWIFSLSTLLILFGHILCSFIDKKAVKKMNISGLSFLCIPMINTFQIFYMISATKKIKYSHFFNSFSWTSLDFLLSPNLNQNLHPIILFTIITFIYTLLLVLYLALKPFQTYKPLRLLSNYLNFSIPIHLFSISSPVLLSSSLHYLIKTQTSSQLGHFISNLSIIIISSAIFIYLLFISSIKCKKIYDKQVSSKYSAFFQGLQKYYLTLPITIRKTTYNFDRTSGPKNTLIQKIKRKGSYELKVEEDKPKFFSCPWKQNKVVDDDVEIAEFNLFDPLDENDAGCNLNVPESQRLKINHYMVSMVILYLRVIFVSFALVHDSFWYLLGLLSVIYGIYFIKAFPYFVINYNFFHFAFNSSQFLILLLIVLIEYSGKTISVFIISIAIIQSVALVFGNFYEIFLVLKKTLKKHRRSGTTLPITSQPIKENEKSKIVEVHQCENFYTEPIQSSREVPPRNCLSFIESEIELN